MFLKRLVLITLSLVLLGLFFYLVVKNLPKNQPLGQEEIAQHHLISAQVDECFKDGEDGCVRSFVIYKTGKIYQVMEGFGDAEATIGTSLLRGIQEKGDLSGVEKIVIVGQSEEWNEVYALYHKQLQGK